MYDISCSVHQVLFFPNYIESSWRPPPEAVVLLFLVQLCMCYTEVYTPTKCCCCFWCLLLLGVLQNVILPGICKLLHDTQCLSNVHRQIMHSTGWYLLFFLWMAHGETTSPRYGYYTCVCNYVSIRRRMGWGCFPEVQMIYAFTCSIHVRINWFDSLNMYIKTWRFIPSSLSFSLWFLGIYSIEEVAGTCLAPSKDFL